LGLFVGDSLLLTVFLRWSISWARRLEMAFRTVDCANVTIKAEGILAVQGP
jgi:hypothetical protein